MTRQLISLFANQNPLYSGATVTFLAVDEEGELTGANIALFTSFSGSTQATNPQTLNASGMLSSPLYFDDAHKVRIVKPGVGIDTTSGVFQPAAAGSGVESFVDLDDVPSSYSGQGGKQVRVNSGATGLEFVTPAAIPTTIAGLDVPAYAGNARRILALDATPVPAWVRNTGHDLAGEVVVGDANGAAVVGTTPRVIRQSGTLTAARTYAMPSQVSGYSGLQYRLVREGGGNFAWTITGLGTSGSETLSLDTAGDSAIVEFSGGAFRAAKSTLAIAEPQDLHGLVDDGETDNTVALKELIDGWVTDGVIEGRITGRENGLSEILLSGRVVVDAMPPSVVFSRVHVLLGKRAGIFIRGRQVELPLAGKAKLAADVDVSGGTVASFDVDLSANEAELLSLLTTDADVVVRGQNGLDGDTLEGHKLEDSVVSLVPVSGTIYTLTLARGLTGSVGPTWYRVWAGSEHLTQPDETLISVVASALLTADATDSDTLSIAEGRAATLGLAAGDWVEVMDDRTGADTAGTSAELVHRQMAQIDAIVTAESEDDQIVLTAVIAGALTTAKRARIVKLAPAPRFRLEGPGPAYPVTRLGVPDPYPASRVHAIQTEYCIASEVTGWHFKREVPAAFARGAAYRDTLSWKPHFHHNRIERAGADIAEAYTGGDLYGVWIKGSFDPVVEHNEVSGGRHCIVFANTTGGTMRWNDMSGAAFQLGDVHGEGETRVAIYGNVFRRGEAWAGRSFRVAFQIANPTHLYGCDDIEMRGNFYQGFTGADDVGIRVVSGARNVRIDEHFTDQIGTGVLIDADYRAPDVLISNIVIDGSADGATTGVAIDGRMQVWESGGTVTGSSSRLAYIDDATGTRRYSTPDSGTLGTTNPEATSGTEVSGDITLTYVGLVAEQVVPIDGVKILGDMSRATIGYTQHRAANVVYGNNPLPHFVESDGSGNWALSWNDDIRDKGKIILSRAEGDIAALVAILPADLPIGPEVVLLVPEAATIRAQVRTFSVAASWVDDAGQGLVTLDDTDGNGDPVTTATLGLTAGDAVTHSQVTTISEIVSASQFKTVAASGTGSGTVSIVAPADTIDEARTLAIGSNSIAGGGTNMVFYRVTESTPTARGKIKSGERPLYANGVIADNSTSALAGETVQAQLDELAGLIDTAGGLSSITPQISAPNSTSGTYTLTNDDAVLALDEGDLVVTAGVVAKNTDNPATALTELLPTSAEAGRSYNIVREKAQTGEVKVRGADYNLVLTATATSGSPTLTGLTEAQTAWIAAGDAVSGTHVAGGATILSKTTTTLTMSGNATGSGSTSITVVVREAVFGRASDAPRDLTLPAPGPNSEAIITSLVCLRQTTTGPFVPACWLTSERENGGSLTIPVELGTSVSSPSISFSGTLDAELHNGRQINATNDITIPVTDGLKVLIYATTSLDVNAGGAAVAMVEGDMIYVFVVGSEVRYTPVLATSEMATS